ncbi:TPA: multidrug efflux MFS transporter EmrD-3 [Vibrio cholerae]|uniref:multidrug efflux MFS transporter EmrD-3 n=1 Tax=Vibrio cholerae TaxID=666 RepID=UPI000B48ADC0|nr:multidrug efflux MFS transporter EmrD-3 [Vibrio cholerae]KAA1200391.1 multidrug efflux MFS transporter EmrD-3 [Vibrio cholerae]KAA1204053.1 multidrug efflux MFS transporter EmrD-3 [Vibrio cholerae]KAA1208794.1 multidrug efflux MFS transporter EmrD-3 [Vibrio cholerae]KAA1221590.1 multidrug efflux MFS transporter EmrD-3 [Vibrio cholerae]MBD1191447.1 multidrug efflux MFS transporter EmrD-3 [Vibrio cholerae]
MKTKPSLWLMVIMLMFPQIVETIYSPVLGSIARSFSVSDAQAAQTLSVYFLAFALGVVIWGVLADKWGRRPTMLVGLLIYGSATFIAMQTDSFTILMLARVFSAFGIAVGSVVTQTILRDVFSGHELRKVFSLMGIGISISPVLGMLLGGQLAFAGGHQLVFLALFFIALVLFVYNLCQLPETQQVKPKIALGCLVARMFKDKQVLLSALLVALYNVALFSYYQLGAFIFSDLGLDAEQFGYSGIALGLGSLIGSFLNKTLLAKQVPQRALLLLAALLLIMGTIGVSLTLDSIGFVAAMILVVIAYGMAIPNILSTVLVEYKSQAGSAGALFGLLYYLLIGSGLALTGLVQHLGVVLLMCAGITLLATLARSSHIARLP